jgi:hypothetical protein
MYKKNDAGSDSCDADSFDASATTNCSRFVFDRTEFSSTLTTELSLVCGDVSKRHFIDTVMMMGLLAGSLLGGPLGTSVLCIPPLSQIHLYIYIFILTKESESTHYLHTTSAWPTTDIKVTLFQCILLRDITVAQIFWLSQSEERKNSALHMVETWSSRKRDKYL